MTGTPKEILTIRKRLLEVDYILKFNNKYTYEQKYEVLAKLRELIADIRVFLRFKDIFFEIKHIVEGKTMDSKSYKKYLKEVGTGYSLYYIEIVKAIKLRDTLANHLQQYKDTKILRQELQDLIDKITKREENTFPDKLDDLLMKSRSILVNLLNTSEYVDK